MKYIQKIRTFNFAEGDFNSLPVKVFQLNPNTLSPTDRAILDAIKFQITVSKYNAIYQNINQSISDTQLLGQFRTSSLVFGTEIRLIRNFVGVPMALFFLLSLAYYANVNLNLGMDFLTEIFA